MLQILVSLLITINLALFMPKSVENRLNINLTIVQIQYEKTMNALFGERVSFAAAMSSYQSNPHTTANISPDLGGYGLNVNKNTSLSVNKPENLLILVSIFGLILLSVRLNPFKSPEISTSY